MMSLGVLAEGHMTVISKPPHPLLPALLVPEKRGIVPRASVQCWEPDQWEKQGKEEVGKLATQGKDKGCC